MSEYGQPKSMHQAPDSWKMIAYLLLAPAVALGVYGIMRFIVATFILGFSRGGDGASSMFLVVCYPAMLLLTPVISLVTPYTLVRDATKVQTRNLMIVGSVLLAIALTIFIITPEWAQILWGL